MPPSRHSLRGRAAFPPWRGAPWLIALFCALWLPALGCKHPSRSERKPNILLVTLDTTRADHCSAYGYGPFTTPQLEKLAAEGVRFDVAYAPMSTTGPSHATMFTSLLPRSHGILKNGYRLSAQPTLASALLAAGYQTGAVVSSFAINRRFGLDQGFQTYDDDFAGARGSVSLSWWEGQSVPGPFDRRADETRPKALAWLEQHHYLDAGAIGRSDSLPFFLWVHFFDPHSPYDPPQEHLALFPPASQSDLDRKIAAYDAEIHFADEELGKLLRELRRAGRLDDTLVVVAGDHGEGLMQHGHMAHGLLIYEEAVRVPLVVRWPSRVTAGRRVGAPVQLVDLASTILDLVGLPALPGRREGLSFAPFLTSAAEPNPLRPVFLQRRLYDKDVVDDVPVKGEKFAARSGRWKYIAAQAEGTFELYDLEADPRELHNLYATQPDPARSMAELLDGWLRNTVEAPQNQVLSDEDVRRLRALGYTQ